MIEKNIFFIWFGDNCNIDVVNLYKKINPTFKYFIINENSYHESTNIDVINCRKLIEDETSFYYYYYNRESVQWLRSQTSDINKCNAALFSDCLRLYLLDKYGGIYIDFDTEPKCKFDDELMNNNSFISQTICQDYSYIDCFFIGAQKGFISSQIGKITEFNKWLNWYHIFYKEAGTLLLPAISNTIQNNKYINHYYKNQWR